MERTTPRRSAERAGAGAVRGSEAEPTASVNGALSATAAAPGLATEVARMLRLIAVAKHHTKSEPGAADRILLARLVMDGPRRATDLAADTFLDLSTVSRQVRSLVDRGLVDRQPDPEDRRVTLLSATGPGREAFEQYRRQRDAELAALLHGWPPEDRYQLVRLMRRLNDNLMEHHSARHCPEKARGCQRNREIAR